MNKRMLIFLFLASFLSFTQIFAEDVTISGTDAKGESVSFNITVFKITTDAYAHFLNGVACGNDPYHLYDDEMNSNQYTFGIRHPNSFYSTYETVLGYANHPVAISGLDAMRYVNWASNFDTSLRTSEITETGTYLFPPSSSMSKEIYVNKAAICTNSCYLFDEEGHIISTDEQANLLAKVHRGIFYVWYAYDQPVPFFVDSPLTSHWSN